MWSTSAPSNPICLSWKVLLDRVQSKVNLVKRYVSLPSAVCSLCATSLEFTDHLFFPCPFAWQVWARIVNWLGWSCVFPSTAKDHLRKFFGDRTAHETNGLYAIWVAVIWQLWIARNSCGFFGQPAAVLTAEKSADYKKITIVSCFLNKNN